MKYLKSISAIFFLITLMPFVLTAHEVRQSKKHYVSLLDRYMRAQVELYRFNGNVLVAKNGNVVYQKSFGYGNFDSMEMLTANSLFDSGSIGKQFTAVSVLMLMEKGKLDLDDQLQKYFPGLSYPGVTIRHMLTHTSGLPEYFDLALKHWDLEKVANNNDVIRLLEKEKPTPYFKPGEDLKYSNTSYDLLASIIEKISGQSWGAFVTEQILKPLGMSNSTAYNIRIGGKPPRPGIVYGYLYSEAAKKYVLSETLPEYKGIHAFDDIYGSGGINISAGDLLKWDRALKNHTLLSEAVQNAMLSVQSSKTATTPAISFGYGPSVGTNSSGRYFFSTGHWPGFKSMFIHYVDPDVSAIVLSNNESQSDYIADALAGIVMDKEIVTPSAHTEVSMATSVIDRYTGHYLMTKLKQYYMITWRTTLLKKNDKLYVHLDGSSDKEDIELKPESQTKFFYGDETDRQIEFEVDKNGKLAKVWQITWGIKREVSKIN